MRARWALVGLVIVAVALAGCAGMFGLQSSTLKVDRDEAIFQAGQTVGEYAVYRALVAYLCGNGLLDPGACRIARDVDGRLSPRLERVKAAIARKDPPPDIGELVQGARQLATLAGPLLGAFGIPIPIPGPLRPGS